MLTEIFISVLILTGLVLAYFYLLLLWGRQPITPRLPTAESWLRLAVILPAHNEELVIGSSVRRLLESNYPQEKFDVHVVADHCTDRTATEAMLAGAIVHERSSGLRGRKGYALGWLFPRILADERRYDAVVIFDADSRVDAQFLLHMNDVLKGGHSVVQGRHMISNPDHSVFAALADGDMRVNNRIRNQAKTNLRLSARLMGDAMCFHRDVLTKFPWVEGSSLAEDREYGLHLVLQGVKVYYHAAALSAGQAAMRWKDAAPQRLRWYGGVIELQKRYLGQLLESGIRNRNLAALDFAVELLIPPFSFLLFTSAITLVISLWLSMNQMISWYVCYFALVLTSLGIFYPLLSLIIEQAPPKTILALVYGPVYILWRVMIGINASFRQGKVPWIRTRRAEEMELS